MSTIKVKLPGGEVVDAVDDGDAVLNAEDEAHYAARADELEVEQRARVGRPSLSGPGRHSPQIAVRLSPSLNERLRKRAADEGKRPSELVREALEAYIG